MLIKRSSKAPRFRRPINRDDDELADMRSELQECGSCHERVTRLNLHGKPPDDAEQKS